MVLQIPFHPHEVVHTGLPGDADSFCNDYTDIQEEASWWIPLSYVAKVRGVKGQVRPGRR